MSRPMSWEDSVSWPVSRSLSCPGPGVTHRQLWVQGCALRVHPVCVSPAFPTLQEALLTSASGSSPMGHMTLTSFFSHQSPQPPPRISLIAVSSCLIGELSCTHISVVRQRLAHLGVWDSTPGVNCDPLGLIMDSGCDWCLGLPGAGSVCTHIHIALGGCPCMSHHTPPLPGRPWQGPRGQSEVELWPCCRLVNEHQ